MSRIIKKEEVTLLWSDEPVKKSKGEKVKLPEIIPNNYTLSLRPEKGGRGGKTVSVLYDYPQEYEVYFKKLSKTLKKLCGSGGTYKGASIEIQGNHIETIKEKLGELGFKVKITGG